MRRRPLPHGGPLRPGAGLRRQHGLRPGKARLRARTGLPKRNPKRLRLRWLRAYESEARVAWTKAQLCVVPGCTRQPCEMAHVVSRAAGGTADETVPMCAPHHRLQHDMGVETFAAYFGIDLAALAAQMAAAWRREREF